jgi:hypothetical protein
MYRFCDGTGTKLLYSTAGTRHFLLLYSMVSEKLLCSLVGRNANPCYPVVRRYEKKAAK